MELNINSEAVVAFTNKLEKMHRSALPLAIRGALNAAAFDVKTRTMPKEAKVFVQRNPTFFKSTSKVDMANGFNVNTMQSVVGFLPQTGAKESGGATKDLEQQEYSGEIGNRSFIALKGARAGNSFNRRVKNKMRLAVIKSKIVDAKKSKARTNSGKFFSSAQYVGVGGFVLSNWRNKQGNRLLMSIDSIKRDGGNSKVKYTPVYSVKGNRSVKVKSTKFMRKASTESANKIELYFIEQAERQIAKLK